MANRQSWGTRLLLAIALLSAGIWLAGEARAQAVVDEARQAGRSAQSFPAADEDYFRGMDGGIALTPDEVKGRNMWIVWTGGDDRLWDDLTNLTFGNFDLLKILSSYPGLKYSRDNRWNYFGLVNEPCFTKAAGPNPQRYGLWLDVRDPNCPADPFRECRKIPRRRGRRARQEHPGGVVLRIPKRDRRTAALSQPRFRRSRGERMECRAVLQRSQLLPVEGAGAALPRRRFLRFLSRRAEPREAAGEPRGATMGEFELDRRRAIFLGRPHLCVERGPIDLFLPVPAYRPARVPRYVAGVERQHQQSAHDERGLQPPHAAGGGQALGPRDIGAGQPRQQAVQRFCHPGSADAVFSAARYGVDPACAEGRRRFGRRARGIEPGLPEYRSVQRGMAASFQPDPRRQAGHSDRDHDGTRQLGVLGCDRVADPGHGAVPAEGVVSAQAEERAGRRRVLERPAGRGQSGQDRLCRKLRGLPFQQGAAAAGRDQPGRMHRLRLSRLLEPLLGMDQNQRLQAANAADRQRRRFSRPTITCRTTCACR